MSEKECPCDDDRLRLVHVVAPGPFGGLESMVAVLATGLTRRHHTVCVAAILDLEPVPHPFESALAGAGVEVVALRLPPRAYGRERRLLSDVLRSDRPEAVHTHGYRADVQAGAVARHLGIPTVATVHGFTGGDWKNRLYECLQLRALRRSNAVVAVSRPLTLRLRAAGISADRLHLLQNAWGGRGTGLSREQARRALGLGHGSVVVGWVGRLSLEKGADVLLDALRLADPSLVACMIGDGPQRPALTARARELGIEQRVRWCGALPEAGRLFSAFDVFALSSRTEGTPMVLFEAMDAGIPVVATAVGGVPDVVAADNAWLVPAGDAPSLARALDEVLRDPREAERRVAAAGRQLAERFGLEPWLDAYERIYRGIQPGARAAAARENP